MKKNIEKIFPNIKFDETYDEDINKILYIIKFKNGDFIFNIKDNYLNYDELNKIRKKYNKCIIEVYLYGNINKYEYTLKIYK